MRTLKEKIALEPLYVPSLEKIQPENLVDGNYKFEIDQTQVDAFFLKKDSPYLLVFFSGARDPNKSVLPYYNRWSWADKMPGSCLYISDPTFNINPQDLKLAWYIGTEKHDWMQSILKIIKKIIETMGIKEDNVIFYGSSGGGFAALKAVGLLNNGVAIAINPQTDILKYVPAHVDNYLKIAFNCKAEAVPDSVKKERFSVFSGLVRSRKAKFIILQNLQDSFHYKNHYLPLCSYLGLPPEDSKDQKEIKRYNTWIYDCESGHGAEPSDLVPKMIEHAIQLTKTNFLKLSTLKDGSLILPRRKLSSLIEFSDIEDILDINAKKIYGASDSDLEIRGEFFAFNRLHLTKLNQSHKVFLDRFDALDGNLISYNNSKKSWLLTGFACRYIRYWYNYISQESDNNNYEVIIKRLKILAYIISNIQAGNIIVGEEDFSLLENIFFVDLNRFLNKNVKPSSQIYLYKKDLLILGKVLNVDDFENLKSKLKYVLNYNPIYESINEFESFEKSIADSRLYRYGFLLLPKNINVNFSDIGLVNTYWKDIYLGEYVLHLHYELPVLKFGSGNSEIYILGDVFVAHGNLTIEEIASRFISTGDWDLIDLLSGRFSILVQNDGDIKIFSDPFGARTIYYKISDKGTFVSSHSKLLADASSSEISSVVKNYMKSTEYNNKTTKYLPGDLTIFDGVLYLIPNNYLSLKLQNTFRFWPRKDIKPTSLEELKKLTNEYFVNFSKFLNNANHAIYFGLTGGVDTRIIIAASKALGLNFSTLTWDYHSLGYYERDLINGISDYLGKENLWLNFRTGKQAFLSSLSQVSNANSGLVRGSSDLVPKTFSYVSSSSIFVRGLGGEILRGAYNKSVSKHSNLSSLEYFIKMYNGSRNVNTSLEYDDFTELAFSNYMNRGNYSNLFDHDVGDLFYWEHRMSIWASNLLNEYDVALKNLVGINSRILFEASYGLPSDIRFRRELILDLMLTFDEFLASYPTD